MWIRTERRPLDLCTLRLPLWDLTSFPSRNARDVLGVFFFPLFLRVEKEKGKTNVSPVSLLWNHLRMLMSLGDARLPAHVQSQRCPPASFGSIDGKTVGEKSAFTSKST